MKIQWKCLDLIEIMFKVLEIVKFSLIR